VALLLWGTNMVRTGITRSFGGSLRKWLGWGLRTPVRSLVSGIGVTLLLQSSTATALLLTSFATRGIVETAPALAVLLGSDIGTTLVAQFFTLRMEWLAPLLVLSGVVLYRKSTENERQEFGRALVGLGLMIFSLKQIVATTLPLRDSGILPALLPTLGEDRLIVVVIGALMAWLAHSSLASVLLVITLLSTAVVPHEVAFLLVLGVNLGGVFPALASTLGKPPAAKRLSFGNLFFKLVGVVVCLPLLGPVMDLITRLDPDPARQIANFHTAFNLALAVIFLFLTPTVARFMAWLLPDEGELSTSEHPRYLDLSVTRAPGVAIALAEQETLHMADKVLSMLRPVLDIFRTDNRRLVQEVEAMDDDVDRLNEAIKIYLTRVSREAMSERESRRIIDIITFATNLEHIGDIVDKNLMDMAMKKARNGRVLSEEGMKDIAALHERVVETFALAVNVFMTGNLETARKLLAEKATFRELERQASERHLERLSSGKMQSIDSSSIHMDILRDLKRINSHLIAVVYPILDQAGQLWNSRLKEQE